MVMDSKGRTAMLNKEAKMSKFSFVCSLTLGLAVFGYVPAAFAIKVVRDPTISSAPVPPKVAPPAPSPPPDARRGGHRAVPRRFDPQLLR